MVCDVFFSSFFFPGFPFFTFGVLRAGRGSCGFGCFAGSLFCGCPGSGFAGLFPFYGFSVLAFVEGVEVGAFNVISGGSLVLTGSPKV